MTDLATMAADEFRSRREAARRAVARGAWSAERANAQLLPWLAVAAAAGSDLPELIDHRRAIYPRPGPVTPVRLQSWEICDAARWQAELAQAHAAAVKPEDRTRLGALCAALLPADQPRIAA